METFNTIPHFKFWCQKVLPLVYDDSLSYMELLCKVINYLNHIIDDVNQIPEIINSLISDEKLEEVMTKLLDELREQIARANEGTNTTASFDRDKGELVWLDGKLIVMTRDILAGDRYVEEVDSNDDITGNFVYTSIEIEINKLKTEIEDEIGDLSNLTTEEKSSIVDAINELVSDITSTNEKIGDLTELTTENKSSVVNAINEVVQSIVDKVGDLAELTTEDKTNIVNAINEIITTFNDEIGDLSDLDTTNKNNIVSAINEIYHKSDRGWVTPEDYGALGLPNDDTEAIQAAINDGKPIRLTQNYKITHLDIRFDTSRLLDFDGEGHILFFAGDDNNFSAITFSGVRCSIRNLKLFNSTTSDVIGIFWTSEATNKPSEFNKFDNIEIQNFKTGIFYGVTNPTQFDTSQSENFITHFQCRDCELPVYSSITNGFLTIDDSLLISSEPQNSYTLEESRGCCVRCDYGNVIVSDSELAKITNTEGFGIWGANLFINNCVMECASSWAYISGTVRLNNISGGYFSQGVTKSPFIVDPNAYGELVLNQVKMNVPSLSNSKLVKSSTGHGNRRFMVMINNCEFINLGYTLSAPICDYQFTINGSKFLENLTNPNLYQISNLNYSKLTPFNSSVTSDDTSGAIVITCTDVNGQATAPTYEIGNFCDLSVCVGEMIGTWSALIEIKTREGTTTYNTIALHEGVNSFTAMYGMINACDITLTLRGTNDDDSIKVYWINVNAQNEK